MDLGAADLTVFFRGQLADWGLNPLLGPSPRRQDLPVPGPTLATAYPLALEVGDRAFRNWVTDDGGAKADCYELLVEQPTRLTATLGAEGAAMDLLLGSDRDGSGRIDRPDERLAQAIAPEGGQEEFDILLNPGRYWLETRSRGRATPYTLKLSAAIATDTPPPALAGLLRTPPEQVASAVDWITFKTNSLPLWNEVAQQAVRNTAPGPTIAARAYAIVNTAAFDAWSAYEGPAVGTQLGDRLQRPASEDSVQARNAAVSHAAYRALLDLFPSQRFLFDAAMAALGLDPAAGTGDLTGDRAASSFRSQTPIPTKAQRQAQLLGDRPAQVGRQAAEALLAARHQDGSNQLGDRGGGPYQDYTGYAPVNGPFSREQPPADPNRWQPLTTPLGDPNGRPQRFLTPHWGTVTPFALETGAQFRPGPPPQFGSPEYEAQHLEILNLSAALGDREKVIAEFWEDGPGTSFPPGTWIGFGSFVSRRDRHSLDEDMALFFPLANALLDASIAAWDVKRTYDSQRPITGIAALFGDRPVEAWGGPGKGTQTIPANQFLPYQALTAPTPPFAEYVSGHSTFSAAAATILQRVTGSDRFGNSFTQPAGANRFDGGVSPQQPVTLAWDTFTAAAQEAGISRLYGGIHIAAGNEAGQTLGQRVGDAVWNRAIAHLTGQVS
ncbi:MAG: vanadium-dependent haloperoxidase [Cyanobacteria bacterium]|nr:vanadium-dependent haloperoxidase [Cyanobacteriota bacterium]